jgi:DUF1680 family protein
MLKAIKANKVVRIADEQIKNYKALGFKITDMEGKVVYDPAENSDNAKELKAIIEKKDAEIEKLNAKILDLQAQLAEKDDADDANADGEADKDAEIEKSAKKAAAKK